jgi:anti-anti-sigma factor
MSSDGVFYSYIGKCCIIRLVGAIKYTTVAADFEKFIDTFIDKPDIIDVIIDMRECNYIDSTDLGILARISITQNQKNANKPVIVHTPDSGISTILKDVGFGRVFTLTDTITLQDTKFSDIESGEKQTELELAKMMVTAHEELIDMDESNLEKFSSVVNFMKKSIEQLEK